LRRSVDRLQKKLRIDTIWKSAGTYGQVVVVAVVAVNDDQGANLNLVGTDSLASHPVKGSVK
jgi:hypothetical protein